MVWVINSKAIEASWEEILEAVAEIILRVSSKYGKKEK